VTFTDHNTRFLEGVNLIVAGLDSLLPLPRGV
jgi:hypothetical protein